ncbi:GNAT family N-acetyltransferase [Magnetospirillum sp. SS-4]|jgi:RimJ/RimL family protein N-acetyltransferase|uniref:GNAT family N-acetyltransferase n=1 Tax=Magnetospirillum sp. SS-4 TaxID=2681465 RepID=UPI00137C7798|nr:GNAT family protein [Magnetospirillum sp. SS-4]CAA7619653.1 GCN5-related N-acetyltransferase [Magnetospirillum sp. SS-4]
MVELVSFLGSKVRLRPLRREDGALTAAWRNDPAIRDCQLGHRFPVTAEMEAAWFDSRLNDRSGGAFILAIEDLADDAFVGYAHLRDIDWIGRTAEFGISIGAKDRQGRGLGRESLDIMVCHGFTVLNLNRIWLRAAAFNDRAIALFRSAGFSREGVMRQHAYVGGQYYDVVLMGLMRDEHREGAITNSG